MPKSSPVQGAGRNSKRTSNDFLQAYNFARRLKPLKGLNLYEYLWKLRTQSLDRFTLNPIHQILGLDI
jgi:hypothetical protein